MIFHRIQAWLIACLMLAGHPALAAEPPNPNRELRIGADLSAFPNQLRADLEITLRYWAEELGQQAKIPTHVQVYETANEIMANDFRAGRFDLLITSPLQFVTLLDKSELADGFKTSQSDLPMDSLVILTQKDAGYDNFKQLAGKRIITQKNAPLPAIYLETLCAETFQQRCERVLSIAATEKNADQLIFKLFFGQTDAVITNKASFLVAAELNPQIFKGLQILKELEGVPLNAGYFHVSVPEDFRELVINKATNITQFHHGKALLEVFKSDNIARSQVGDLSVVESLYRRYQITRLGKH